MNVYMQRYSYISELFPYYMVLEMELLGERVCIFKILILTAKFPSKNFVPMLQL